MAKLKWTIEISVDKIWVADGFDCTDDDALDMLANRLRSANIGTELKARVVKRPAAKIVAKLQGGTVESVQEHRKNGANR